MKKGERESSDRKSGRQKGFREMEREGREDTEGETAAERNGNDGWK